MGQVTPHAAFLAQIHGYTDTDHIYKLNGQISPKPHMCIAHWVFTSHEKFQINPCTKSVITEVLVKGVLLHWKMSLLFCSLYSTYFKSENWGLSSQMKIWQLTFLDSAYSKYESKLELPLLPKNALISVF